MHAVSEILSIPPGRVSRPVMPGAGHHPAPAPDFSSMTWDELIAYIRVTPEAWPADPDEVPAFVLAHEERARRRGYSLAGQPRTRREFEALVRACRATLGLTNDELSVVGVVEVATPTVVQVAHAATLHLVSTTPQPLNISSRTTPTTLSVVGNSQRQVSKRDALRDLLSMDEGAPSQEWLAKRWRRHKGTVSNWMAEWEARGLIERVRRGSISQCSARVSRSAAA